MAKSGHLALVQRPAPKPGDYCPSDPEMVGLSNLGTRLFITKVAGESDWSRWATMTQDPDIAQAVATATAAVAAAQEIVAEKLSLKAKEG